LPIFSEKWSQSPNFFPKFLPKNGKNRPKYSSKHSTPADDRRTGLDRTLRGWGVRGSGDGRRKILVDSLGSLKIKKIIYRHCLNLKKNHGDITFFLVENY
jgi:hypothetical protein